MSQIQNPMLRRIHNIKVVQSCKGNTPDDARAAMRLTVTIPYTMANGDIGPVRSFIADA